MLFKSELIALILAGQKTQTRRALQTPKGGGAPNCYYRVGTTHALERERRYDEMTDQERRRIWIGGERRWGQHRHAGPKPRHRVGRIRIDQVRREPLGTITVEDAAREGFPSIAMFGGYWIRAHDKRWLAVADMPEPDTDFDAWWRITTAQQRREIAARFSSRWAPAEVWVVTFALIASPLLLSDNPLLSGDYVDTTHNERGDAIAMLAENEAVHPDIVDGWAKDPNSTHSRIKAAIADHGTLGDAQRALDNRLLSQEERARIARNVAKQRGINLRREARVYHDAKLRQRTPEHLEQLVRRMEERAYRDAGQRAA